MRERRLFLFAAEERPGGAEQPYHTAMPHLACRSWTGRVRDAMALTDFTWPLSGTLQGKTQQCLKGFI